jgi:hypothetical protein
MKNNMSNHMVFLIFLLLYRRKQIRTILNYINTFGLTEGKGPSVTHEQIQASVNSTGVLFTYL